MTTQHSWLISVLISTKKSTHRLISLGTCHSQWKNMETTVLSAHFCRWSCNLFKFSHCPKGSNNSNQVQLSFLKDLMMLVKWQNCSDCKDANKGYNKNQKKIKLMKKTWLAIGECPKLYRMPITSLDLVGTHPIDESSIPCCNKTTFRESRLKKVMYQISSRKHHERQEHETVMAFTLEFSPITEHTHLK